jgi:hypothetical protein
MILFPVASKHDFILILKGQQRELNSPNTSDSYNNESDDHERPSQKRMRPTMSMLHNINCNSKLNLYVKGNLTIIKKYIVNKSKFN